MTDLPMSELRGQLTEIANLAIYNKKRTVVKKNGKAVFAIVPISDMRTLIEHEEMENRLDNVEADKALAEGDFVELKEFLAEIEDGKV